MSRVRTGSRPADIGLSCENLPTVDRQSAFLLLRGRVGGRARGGRRLWSSLPGIIGVVGLAPGPVRTAQVGLGAFRSAHRGLDAPGLGLAALVGSPRRIDADP